MKTQQFKQIVRKIVQEELAKSIRPVMKEVMAEMLMEMAVTRGGTLLTDNTHKAKTLREAAYMNSPEELDEYPTLGGKTFDRQRMSEILGYGDMNTFKPSVEGGSGLNITLDHAMNDNGTPVPINPNQIPDAVLKAMNRDYRPLMKELDKKKNNG